MPLLVPKDGKITFTRSWSNDPKSDQPLVVRYCADLVEAIKEAAKKESGFLSPIQRTSDLMLKLEPGLTKMFWSATSFESGSISIPADRVRVNLRPSQLQGRKVVNLGPVEVLDLFLTGQLQLNNKDVLSCLGLIDKSSGQCAYALSRYANHGVSLYTLLSLMRNDNLCAVILLD